MAEEKFTPGPWHWHQQGDYWLLVSGPRGEPGEYLGDCMICSDGSACGEYGQDIDPQGPNARIMAAAPSLLRELQHLVRLMEPLENGGTLAVPGFATLNGARQAIAEAIGEGDK